MHSFHFACKSLLNDSVYEYETKSEIIMQSFIVILNGIVFSIVINTVGNII